MAKILVADDNSNIQKMVGLALKDQGIDVVAVGNGEAAVRKISDVRPDLVLADVFMPVRNGYEVCKYVKEDSALAHIPVILLVGAFDPLDEQEAQRVGADGVLKKPFVPPDPLISMVKSALTRAGVAHPSGASFAQESAPPPLRAADLLTPPQANAFTPPPPAPVTEPEPFHEPIPKKPEPFTIESNAQPLAFGSLLETAGPPQEAVDDTAYAIPTSSPLVPERTWGAEETAEESDTEEESSGSWRPLGGGDEMDDMPAGRKDWREQAFEALESIKRDAKWTPTKEKTEISEEPAEVPVASVAPEPASPEPSPSAEMPPWLRSVAPQTDVAQSAATMGTAESFVTETPAEPPPAPPIFTDAPYQVREEEPAAAVIPPPQESPKPASTDWYSVPSSPWDADAQKASQLASTWDAPAQAPAPAEEIEEEVGTQGPQNVFALSAGPEPILEMEIPAATEEIIREEAVHAVEETVYDLPRSRTTVPSELPAETGSANVDDIVAKVLARMSPEVLQAVTREILKPVVDAIVRDELSKK